MSPALVEENKIVSEEQSTREEAVLEEAVPEDTVSTRLFSYSVHVQFSSIIPLVISISSAST